MLVQHMGHVPDSLPVTEETRERLREQANQLPEPTVLRLCDLLAVAVDDMRQGGDPRLPLELALVKVTRPGADLSRESIAFRVEQLEQRPGGPPRRAAPPPPDPRDAEAAGARAGDRAAAERRGPQPAPPLELEPAAGRLAADGAPGRPVAVDPDRHAARRGAPGRARRARR